MAKDLAEHFDKAMEETMKRFTPQKIADATPVLNAFKFHLLEEYVAESLSAHSYHERRLKQIDRMMASIDYDLGPDGEEPAPPQQEPKK